MIPELLPLNYYLVLTDLLLLSKLVNNYYALNTSEHDIIVRRRSTYRFVLPEIKKKFQLSKYYFEPNTEQTSLIQMLDSKIETETWCRSTSVSI